MSDSLFGKPFDNQLSYDSGDYTENERHDSVKPVFKKIPNCELGVVPTDMG